MKSYFLFFCLCFASLYATAQNKKPCTCLQMFANELDKVEPEAVINLQDHIDGRFARLKSENADFKACADFYSLSYNMWTLGKLRIMLKVSGCAISKKAKKMLEEGPMIYEMDFKLEKQIKDQHNTTEYQQFSDSAILATILSGSAEFVNSDFEGDMKIYLYHLPNWYLNFFYPAEITQLKLQKKKTFDSLQIKVDLKAPKPIKYVLQKDSTLMTLVAHDVKYTNDEKTIDDVIKILAFSEDLGKSWKYIDVTRDKLKSFWALNRTIDPIALENKLNDEGSSKYPAKNGKELGAHFCNCAKDISSDDFLTMMPCINILVKHQLWKESKVREDVYLYVKEHCNQHKDSFIFIGFNLLEEK